ncbi:hypothetical protein OG21DRAFT_1510845 [Imleria badia]|nr:hypothetical protein OG21DRAFT_1510845 [Imleria badia]
MKVVADAVYFTNLPEDTASSLSTSWWGLGSALERKEADTVLMFEAGFMMAMAELLDDIANDAPNAFKFMAIILKGAGFDKDEERPGSLRW